MIQFMRINPDAIIPTRATNGSAGFDLYADGPAELMPGRWQAVGTGVAMAFPATHAGHIRPRSGMAVRDGIDVLAGLVDSDYRGEVKAVLINHGEHPVIIKEGQRIAQIVFAPVLTDNAVEVDALDKTERNTGGFGSTGQ